MLNRNFDPTKQHRYVRYGRMSTDFQNPRSPQQQFDTIERYLIQGGQPWVLVRDYRDDAVSGRLTKKRPQFQAMLKDLKSGAVEANLILVDTFERFGRAEEILSLRQNLQSEHQILVLTADSRFADPTSSAGRALSIVESIRSSEDGRVKAHNVLRGKRDLASRGRWPGGPMPFGYKLQSVLVDRRGCQTLDGHILVPDPATSMVPPKLYALAFETGHGLTRLARALNEDESVPNALKPISAERVRHVLESTLYAGVLTYNRHCTGIINDRIVRDRVKAGEELVVPDFCEPLVERALAEAVWEMRLAARSARPKPKSPRRVEVELESGSSTSVIPRNHLLTGLVRCGECGGSMRISSSKFQRKDKTLQYAYYGCWRHPTRQCDNAEHFREDVLREAVIAKLRWRLFPPPGPADGVPSWLPNLVEEARSQLEALCLGEGDPRPVLRRELDELSGQMSGWSMSLSKAKLDPSLRAELEGLWAEARTRRSGLEARMAGLESSSARLETILDPSAVVERLRRLADVLPGGNIVEVNRELSRHIEQIGCFADRRVELRTHRLGVFDGLSEWFRPGGLAGSGPVGPPEGLYWSDPVDLEAPRRRNGPCWSMDHCEEVLAKLEETGWTVKRLAEHFDRCRETIDTALANARGRRANTRPG
jgi:site-specific DNA recombinase